MNYERVYYSIISKAIQRYEVGIRWNGDGNRYEKHHIRPKSLNGTNDENNLVLLTPREHFIAHWLLVKMFEKGSNERKKMLCAFWKMKVIREIGGEKRYLNSRAYDKLKREFSLQMSDMQRGDKNSMYGMVWYTNRNTGESKRFIKKPSENWICGRNLFKGESSIFISKRKSYGIETAKKLWDQYHSGNYKSIREFSRVTNILTQPVISTLFKKYIPISRRILIPRSKKNGSNKELVGIYF